MVLEYCGCQSPGEQEIQQICKIFESKAAIDRIFKETHFRISEFSGFRVSGVYYIERIGIGGIKVENDQ
jgi:hypothetical protein